MSYPYTKAQLQKEAHRIIALLKKDFVMHNGMLGLQRTNGVLFEHHIFPDLGDFLTFFLYFGEREFVVSQITKIPEILSKGVMVSEFSTMGISGLAKTYEYTDFLLGLIDFARTERTEDALQLLLQHARTAQTLFTLNHSVRSFVSPRFRFALPVLDTRDATLIECFVDLYTLTEDASFLDTAENIFNNLVRLPFFKQNGLFPTYGMQGVGRYIPSFMLPRSFSQVTLCKNNTNALFAFRALYRVTQDSRIQEFIDRMLTTMNAEAITARGGVRQYLGSVHSDTRAYLLPSFSLIDFLCDLYMETREVKYRDQAQRIADFWIMRQSEATGLFPMHEGTTQSFFDSETDMTVALRKLAECTGDKVYTHAADRSLRGLIEVHGKHDYVLGVDIHSGTYASLHSGQSFLHSILSCLF